MAKPYDHLRDLTAAIPAQSPGWKGPFETQLRRTATN